MTPLSRSFAFACSVLLLPGIGISWGQSYSGENSQLALSTANTSKHRTVDNTDGSVDENPRQRRRVLDKRNPLATEYQSIGDIGSVMLSDSDSEGVNDRARFPFGNPFDGPERTGSGEISYKYNDLSGGGFLQAKGTYHQILGEGRKWAITVKGERTGSDQLFEKVGLRWREREFEGQSLFFIDRMRLSLNSAKTIRNQAKFSLDHRLGKRHEVYLKSVIQDRTDEERYLIKRFWFGQGDVVSLAPDSAVVHDASSELLHYDLSGKRKLFRIIAGGDVWGDSSRFDYSVYSSRWERQRPDNINPVFRTEGIDFEYSLSNPAFPAVSVLNGGDLRDPARLGFKEYAERNYETVDNDKAIQVNYEKRMDLGALSGILRTGAVYRSKERTNTYEQIVVDEFDGDLSLDQVVGEDQGLVIRDTYPFGPSLDIAAFRDLTEAESDRFTVNPGRTRIESDTNNYQASEKVTGAYLLQTLKSERWSLRGGIRFEKTQLETTGNIVETDEEGDYVSTETLKGGNEYTRWLGAVELEYILNDSTRLKAAWFQTLARPDYFDLVPYRRITTNFQFISEGNPNLQPTRFDNLVFSAHLENETVGNLNIAGYYKKLDSFFFDSQEFISGGPFDGFKRRLKENGNGASVWGFELGWKRQADFLRPLVGDLTFIAFYTFSETTAETDSRPGEVLLLPERSNHFASVTAKHSLGLLESTFSVTYQSLYLEEIGAEFGLDEFMEDAVKMNLAFNLKLTERLRTFVKFSNFIDWPERTYEGDPSRITDNEYSSWKIDMGLRFKF